ncbi:MAG: hypothetical protein MJZ45_02870 [Bacteroidales bacterium]|nr:hypothetical protein [Bacteroidales bacterium]
MGYWFIYEFLGGCALLWAAEGGGKRGLLLGTGSDSLGVCAGNSSRPAVMLPLLAWGIERVMLR